MKIAILGASGCIGSVLTRHLLDNTSHDLVLFSHHAKDLEFSKSDEKRLAHVDGDVLNKADIDTALRGCSQVIYLIHLMGNADVGRKFEAAEEKAANNVVSVMRKHSISKITYIGGAGNEEDAPTRHLLSRHKTGEIFRNSIKEVIEYRTPMVIGRQAAGYEVIRSLVNALPIIPIPSWGNAITQPIAVVDVVRYIDAAIHRSSLGHVIVDIGGPEMLSYSQIFKRYATFSGKKRLIFVTPLIPQHLVRSIFRLLKRNPHLVTAADMIESSQHSYKVRSSVPKFIEHINPGPIENAFH